MKNMKQIKKQVQIKHSLITGEILELENRSKNEYVRDEFIEIADRIEEEIGYIREIMTNLRIANKMKDVPYLDSFDSDYARRYDWINTCVLI